MASINFSKDTLRKLRQQDINAYTRYPHSIGHIVYIFRIMTFIYLPSLF